MNGLAEAGNSERYALSSAMVFNKSNPLSINIVGLTIFLESKLYKEVQSGMALPTIWWKEKGLNSQGETGSHS